MLYLASDHGGFELRQQIQEFLKSQAVEFVDLGCPSSESCDYPDFGHELARQVLVNPDSRGIGICGTGIGISIALNRHAGIRAARCRDAEDARLAREHNNANVLVLGGRQTAPELAIEMVKLFLGTDFEGGRHERRVAKIELDAQ